MKKFLIKKTKRIKAKKEKVWNVLLTPELFSEWGSAFCPDSHMKGTWKKGGTITYTDNMGMGMKAKVVEFEPNTRVTVEYATVLKDNKVTLDTEQGWIGCRETYAVIERDGTTTLSLESEVPTKKYYEEFSKLWDKALLKIKGLAEGGGRVASPKIYVNLPVKNLVKSKKFYTELGYQIDPQFTDKNAACIVISETIYIMLLVSKFFKTFTKKEISDASKQTEAILSLALESREEVDKTARLAVSAGGRLHRETEDHGWMYLRSFEDLDGHLWEILWMDPTQMKG